MRDSIPRKQQTLRGELKKEEKMRAGLDMSKKTVTSDSATTFPPKLRSQNPANGKIKSILFAHSDFLLYLCSRLLTKFVKTSNFRQ